MPPLAGVHDLEYRLGRPFREDELPRVGAVLEDASALVRDVANRDWIDPGTGALSGVPSSVRAVALKIAERAIRNPGGFSAESAGDYSFQRNGASDGVYLSEREEQIVRRAIGKTGLWTQGLVRGDTHSMNTIWFEDNYGLELFPLDTYYDR